MAKTSETTSGTPHLDLTLERIVDVPRTLMWDGWTKPEHIKRWFTPAPWTTPDCRIDLRPGGEFYTLMRGPDGEEHANHGCFLEIIPEQRLVFTDMLRAGWRPAPAVFPLAFTAIISFEDHKKGTKYTARLLHKDEADRARHEEMGFGQGWNAALDQLVALMKSLQGKVK